jgi:hypothetical protein
VKRGFAKPANDSGLTDTPDTHMRSSVMNVSAIDPSKASLTQSAAAANAPVKKSSPAAVAAAPSHAPSAAPQASVAALATPAATVAISGVPATVKPEDRALYMQILKSVGGNVNAALAGLAAAEAKEGEA